MNAMRKSHGVGAVAVEKNELPFSHPSCSPVLLDPALAVTLDKHKERVLIVSMKLPGGSQHGVALDQDLGQVETALGVLNDSTIESVDAGGRRVHVKVHEHIADGIAPVLQLLRHGNGVGAEGDGHLVRSYPSFTALRNKTGLQQAAKVTGTDSLYVTFDMFDKSSLQINSKSPHPSIDP
jgi:hypothetical protein